MDEPHINGIALGRKTAAISTGLLKVGTDDEITAILAHEAGHLHHKDSILSLALFIAILPTLLLNYLLSGFFRASLSAGDGSPIGLVVGFVLLALFLIIFAYYIVFWAMSFLVLWLFRVFEISTQWKTEYRADEFAMQLGFAPDLIELFERIEDEDIRSQVGFMRKYLYSHPSTALRIDKLERALMANQ